MMWKKDEEIGWCTSVAELAVYFSRDMQDFESDTLARNSAFGFLIPMSSVTVLNNWITYYFLFALITHVLQTAPKLCSFFQMVVNVVSVQKTSVVTVCV